MICISLQEVNLLIEFFKDYICTINKAIRNIVDKIDFFDDEGGILKEEPTHEDFRKAMLKENIE